MSEVLAARIEIAFHVYRSTKDMPAGSYSFVAVGATAQTYDMLAKPVHRRIFFAGEHTCKVRPQSLATQETLETNSDCRLAKTTHQMWKIFK